MGVDGLEAVLELLDGCELPAAAWEPEVLALRVNDYAPALLDQLCFTGRIGWGRLTLPEMRNCAACRPGAIKSDVAVCARKPAALARPLRGARIPQNFRRMRRQTFEALSQSGALFFGEIVRLTRLLPSRVEQALAELAAQGYVTADGFEGLRALLLPEEKRAPFGGRSSGADIIRASPAWSLADDGRCCEKRFPRVAEAEAPGDAGREESIEAFARVLLRRYGVVSRRIAEKESLPVSWFELIRVFRRLEARGEIRGGYFVGGLSGEQFARPEAIGLLRSIRKATAQRRAYLRSAPRIR